MGSNADMILDGILDESGEYIGDGYPRYYHEVRLVRDSDGTTRDMNHDPKNYEKGTRQIRKELAILIKKTKKDNPDGNESKIVNDCRQQINIKYGKGWRQQF